MRVPFKSLVVLSRKQRSVPGGAQLTTTYDTAHVGDHVFDAPTWTVYLDPHLLWLTPLISLIFVVLVLYLATAFTDSRVWKSPGWVVVLVLGPMAVCYPIAVRAAVRRRMIAQARGERLLAPDVTLEVVREAEWAKFRAGLETPNLAAQLLLQREMQEKARRAPVAPPPLPEEEPPPSRNVTNNLPPAETDVRPGPP